MPVKTPWAALLWKLLAIVFVAFGIVGVFLPIVPTVPFLIVAAAAASRGWPWLDRKLTLHPRYGPAIVRWRERGAISRPAKTAATLGMAVGAGTLWFVGVAPWLRWSVLALLVCVAFWIWTRPDD